MSVYHPLDSAAAARDVHLLRKRVQRLENTVSDLLRTLTDDGTIEVTDPDAAGHFEDKD